MIIAIVSIPQFQMYAKLILVWKILFKQKSPVFCMENILFKQKSQVCLC